MKRFLRASALTIGAALTISFAAMTQPSPGVLAQTPASPSPATAASPSPAAAASPGTTTGQSMPRTGGFPMELAWPMLAGGAAAVGAGALLLRRGRR